MGKGWNKWSRKGRHGRASQGNETVRSIVKEAYIGREETRLEEVFVRDTLVLFSRTFIFFFVSQQAGE